jgi:hypothetical protein
MSINANTGVIQWTPGSTGNFNVTVQASNGVGTPATQNFTINVAGAHTVTASAGSGGSIDPSGTIPVNHGEILEFTVTPDAGYKIASVTGCGGTLSGDTYTTAPINADCSVTATFTPFTAVEVLSPNGGEIIPSGSDYTIRWGAPPGTAEFKIKLSLDNGLTWSWITPNPVTGNSYVWTVAPPLGNKKNCLIKVMGYNASHVKTGKDVSNSTFKIEVVRLDYPAGGDSIASGATHSISWTTNVTQKQVTKAKLSYTKDGGATWIAIGNTPGNPGFYDGWFVQGVANPKTNCRVKVELKDKNGIILGQDATDGYFTILPPD